MELRNIIDQFLNNNSFSYTSSTKKSDFTSF